MGKTTGREYDYHCQHEQNDKKFLHNFILVYFLKVTYGVISIPIREQGRPNKSKLVINIKEQIFII